MQETDLDLLYLKAGGTGWGPVDVLADLTARLLGAQMTEINDRGEVSRLRKASSLLPRRRRSGRRLLVLAANPALLAYAARREHWFPGYEQVAAWVIDSFWTDRISQFALSGRHFDHFFITDKDLVSEWANRTTTPTTWLPWGTDTLAVNPTTLAGERRTDLLRMGRQPLAWDDDEANIADGFSLGLRVSGRPAMGTSGFDNQRIVRESMASSKFVLAFNNLVSPAPYTHPTRSYVTARWTDALASGATVVGAKPANAEDILWEGATVEIDPADRKAGLRIVAELVRQWTPDQALSQHQMARERLDWRLRLQQLTSVMGWHPTEALVADLEELGSGVR